MTRKVYSINLGCREGRLGVIPRKGWREGVKAFSARGLDIQQVCVSALNRSEWKQVVMPWFWSVIKATFIKGFREKCLARLEGWK